jgi:hypothetical protein
MFWIKTPMGLNRTTFFEILANFSKKKVYFDRIRNQVNVVGSLGFIQ